MRRVVLDTETTGLDVESGNRIIEVACIELDHRRQPDKTFHSYLYLNPEHKIEKTALEVHGLTNEFLQGQPKFSKIADELFEFLKGAELVIHNAEFDLKFLNSEFQRIPAFPALEDVCEVMDTLLFSRKIRPGGSHSLDALANRYEVDLSKRKKREGGHGAMLDAELLVDVYVAMIGRDVRRIVLATETTGLDVESKNRIIEVACIELDHQLTPTGNTFHHYLNPEREIEEKTLEVLGSTTEFLQDKPKFSDIADDLFEFLNGAELVVHNAERDLKFLNQEFQLIKKDFLVLKDVCKVIDTWQYSLENRPKQAHSLNAIAADYSLDLSKREKPGAMAKAELLVDVYVAMIGRDMRRIALAIETTGLNVESENRIIEVACIELDYQLTRTGNTFHRYLNPEREIKDKPKFSDIADDLFEFLSGAELVVHNAEFDLEVLNYEFQLIPAFPALEDVCEVMDTLSHSRKIRPGGSHSLDALANRYDVDMAKRKKRKDGHGAMLDAELLVDVYVAMFSGQSSLPFDKAEKGKNSDETTAPALWNGRDVVVLVATEEERQAHEKYLDYLDSVSPGGSIWRQNEASQKPDSNQ